MIRPDLPLFALSGRKIGVTVRRCKRRRTSRVVPRALDSRDDQESHRRQKEKRISVDGIGASSSPNDAKTLSNWYAHHFALRLETYEDGKVYGTEFKYRSLSDSSKVDATVFSISQASPSYRREA